MSVLKKHMIANVSRVFEDHEINEKVIEDNADALIDLIKRHEEIKLQFAAIGNLLQWCENEGINIVSSDGKERIIAVPFRLGYYWKHIVKKINA